MEGIYHSLSFYPQIPDGDLMGIVHLKENMFLAYYLDYDYTSNNFTLTNTYHVFSVSSSNGSPNITPIKTETITENHPTDISYLLENFSINLDVYANNYYSVYPFFLHIHQLEKYTQMK